jgi:RNA polymerase sigma-70 factor (ECF subfamily)
MPSLNADSPDGLLVAACLAGDEQAFALLVARYQPALLKAALSRLRRRELAEEAVQESLLCAHRWLATYDSRYSFRTWLWTIVLNQCSRVAKHEARTLGVQSTNNLPLDQAVGSDIDAASPLDRLLDAERSAGVQELLARLPETQADALRLRFFGGLTFPEIAAGMRCSEAGAKNRVRTGLLKLAAFLKAPAEAKREGEAPAEPRKLAHELAQRELRPPGQRFWDTP